MTQHELLYKDNTIAYNIYGSGKKAVICLHGYAQTAGRWAMLEPHLRQQYTLYAIDLPYHGKTRWQHIDTFTLSALLEIIQMILPAGTEKYHLLAYSMGGRIALRLLQEVPHMIEKAVLLAPDGLHRNPWYRFATHTVIGRKIFNQFKKNPKLIIIIGKRLRKQGILSDQLYNLTYYYIHDKEARYILYNRWISTRHFRPDLQLIRKAIAQYQIPVEMVFADQDKIIIADHGIEFMKGLEQQARIHMINTGHSFLYAAQASFIASLFKNEQ